jgi:serine/threonine-protein phosphatase 2A activator
MRCSTIFQENVEFIVVLRINNTLLKYTLVFSMPFLITLIMLVASDPRSRLPLPTSTNTWWGCPSTEAPSLTSFLKAPATPQPSILGYIKKFKDVVTHCTSPSAAMASPSLPRLEVLDRTSPPSFSTPAKRIHETSDVSRFLTSFAYRDIGIFILQLTHAVCPRNKPNSAAPITFSISSSVQTSPAVQALQELLRKIEKIIDEAPPASGPRRFGNISFRKWHELLEERISSMLQEGLLGETLAHWDEKALAEVQSYLLGGFGSAQRLDYGSGHELSFLASIACLWKLGHFQDDNPPEETERQIVLQVVEPYANPQPPPPPGGTHPSLCNH